MLGQRAVSLIPLRRSERSAALLRPGLIDVTAIPPFDEEIFGPLLQLIRVPDFETALARANQTTYGLSAGLLSDRLGLYDQFRKEIRAGVVNFNSPLTGARSDLPFGGLGSSGNHRPSAAYAVDYCRDPVASIESTSVAIPDTLPPGIPATIGAT
jgi:succinylglutamic semialdehyde dehydrogenase